MSIEMGAFLDIGQVFNNSDELGDNLKVDLGISVRMINKPNVGLIFNYAYIDLLKAGGVFCTGIGISIHMI